MSWDPTYDTNFNQIVPSSTIDEWFPPSMGLPTAGGAPGAGAMMDMVGIGGGSPIASAAAGPGVEDIVKAATRSKTPFTDFLGGTLGLDKTKFWGKVLGPILSQLEKGGAKFAMKSGNTKMFGGFGGDTGQDDTDRREKLMDALMEMLEKGSAVKTNPSPQSSTVAGGTSPFRYTVIPSSARPLFPEKFGLPGCSSCG